MKQPAKRRRRKKWDAFLSHASEDKQTFVEPLAAALAAYGLHIWFDKFTLTVGDSLREKIDEGLASSRLGIVVFSPHFFAKKWPTKELNGLFSREIAGKKVILPVWHNITQREVVEYSPLLADKIAISSASGVAAVARALVAVIRPGLLATQSALHNANIASSHLRNRLQERFPYLDYRVSVGPRASDFAELPPSLFSMVEDRLDDALRIDVFAKDPNEYNKNPVNVTFTMSNEAWRKLNHAMREGDTVSLSSEELIDVQSNVFEMVGLSRDDVSTPRALVIAPAQSPLADTFHWQIACEHRGERVEYPYLTFKKLRQGTARTEVESRNSALLLRLTFRPDRSNVTIGVTFDGRESRDVRKAMHMTRLVAGGGPLQIIDLDTNKTLGKMLVAAPQPWALPPVLEDVVEALHDIATKLHTTISWGSRLTDDDVRNALLMAAAVRTGTIQVPVDSITFTLPKDRIPVLETAIAQGHVLQVTLAHADFAQVFGHRIDLGPHELSFKASSVHVHPNEHPTGEDSARTVTFTLQSSIFCWFAQFFPRPSVGTPSITRSPILLDAEAYTRYARRILPFSAFSIGAIRLYEHHRRSITALSHTVVLLELAAALASDHPHEAEIARRALAALYEHCKDDEGRVRTIPDNSVTLASLLFNVELVEPRKLAETLCHVAKTVAGTTETLPADLAAQCSELKALWNDWRQSSATFVGTVAHAIDPGVNWQSRTNDPVQRARAAAALRQEQATRVAAQQQANDIAALLERTLTDDELNRCTDKILAFYEPALQAYLYQQANLVEHDGVGTDYLAAEVLLAIDQQMEDHKGPTVLITGSAPVVTAAQRVGPNAPVVFLDDYLSTLTTKPITPEDPKSTSS